MKAPCPFKHSSSLEATFGLYEAPSCGMAQLSPDLDSMRTTPPNSDGSVNFFEMQDFPAQMDCAISAPPMKRSRQCPELRDPRHQPCQSSERFPEELNVQSEQTSQTHAQMGEKSSSEEQGILPQHHNSALCVC